MMVQLSLRITPAPRESENEAALHLVAVRDVAVSPTRQRGPSLARRAQRAAESRLHAKRGADVGRLLRNLVKDLRQHRVRRNILRLRLEIQQDAMPHRRAIHPSDILKANVVTALQERSHLAGEHQRLSAARARPAADVLVGVRSRELTLWVGC